MNIETIIAILSACGTVIAITLSLRKQPFEINNLDAQAAKQYAEAAKMSADRAEKSESSFDEYRKVNDLEKETIRKELENYKRETAIEREELKQEVAQIREENAELKGWAERLVFQVQSLGGVPVPMKIKRQKETK